MNQEQTMGMWAQIKGSAKKLWGSLADDDEKRAEGSFQKLYGIVLERLGATKAALRRKLDKPIVDARKNS